MNIKKWNTFNEIKGEAWVNQRNQQFVNDYNPTNTSISDKDHINDFLNEFVEKISGYKQGVGPIVIGDDFAKNQTITNIKGILKEMLEERV